MAVSFVVYRLAVLSLPGHALQLFYQSCRMQDRTLGLASGAGITSTVVQYLGDPRRSERYALENIPGKLPVTTQLSEPPTTCACHYCEAAYST